MSALHSWALGVVTAVRARWSSRSLVDPDGATDVALTTYGIRLTRVHLAIESIGGGATRPRTLTLVVDDPTVAAEPPPPLARLIRRGLRLELAEDLGPHKKYVPHVAAREQFDRPLVTADDDVFYPRRWLAELEAVHRAHPTDIVAHRAHHIRLDGDRIAPYETWPPVISTVASELHMATGVGGVLHPPAQLQALRDAGDGFRTRSPAADDLWLHHVALRAGIRVRQVAAEPLLPPWIPGLGSHSLAVDNVGGGGNDRAAAALYDADDRRRLAAERAAVVCGCLAPED